MHFLSVKIHCCIGLRTMNIMHFQCIQALFKLLKSDDRKAPHDKGQPPPKAHGGNKNHQPKSQKCINLCVSASCAFFLKIKVSDDAFYYAQKDSGEDGADAGRIANINIY